MIPENFINEIIELEIDCITAVIMISHIQLATRHPKNHGPSSEIAKETARKLQKAVCDVNPGVAELMEFGWNPE